MKLDNVFKKTKYVVSSPAQEQEVMRPEVPDGLLRKCNHCGAAILTAEVRKGLYICPKCGGYFRIPAYERISMIADEGSFTEWDTDIADENPMDYRGYEKKLESTREKTGLQEALVVGRCAIGGRDAVLGVMDGRFLMASMGHAVGEKITRAFERATEEELPVILFTCSGGARMQEGITSLMQMAKTSAARKRHDEAGLLYISVLTDPTTGGVTASFAMLGDIHLAEPGALIGFAGPRVIEQTIGQKLKKGFQRSEFLLEHGFVDRIVERKHLREELTELLRLHQREETSVSFDRNFCAEERAADEEEEKKETKETKNEITAWDCVQKSRENSRPVSSDYIGELFGDFLELHGDRRMGDDPAIIGGIASFHGMPVTVIGQEKGKTTKENMERNFGMPQPEGYRKALRLMKQAEKFGRPIICFVDTPGAYCGPQAEERGQGEAIAENLCEMSALKVPIVSIFIGEGGSGGALALAVSDEIWMLQNAVYSILSPEGFASILWKDAGRAKEAAAVMKLTAQELAAQGIAETVFAEPEELSVLTFADLVDAMEHRLLSFLRKMSSPEPEQLIRNRYARFRKY